MNGYKDKKNNPEKDVQEDAVAAKTEHTGSTVLSDKEMEGVARGWAPLRPYERPSIIKSDCL